MGVDIDGAQHEFLIFRDDTREIVDDTDIIGADDAQGNAVLRRALPTPLRLDDAVAIATTQFRGIRTVSTMDLDTAVDGDETEYRVAIDG